MIGCSSSNNDSTVSSKRLDNYKADLVYIKKIKNISDNCEIAKASIYYTEIKNGYRYELVMNEPKQMMFNIKIISYSKDCLDDYQPTIGYFDKDSYTISPNQTDKSKNIYKGISLSGRVKEKGPIKIMITYYEDVKLTKKHKYCFEVENEN